MVSNASNLNHKIDHILLRPEITQEDVINLCKEALEYEFASVCVNGAFVPLAARYLRGSRVRVTTTAGFPLGASNSSVKAFEAERAIELGAREIDMMIHVGALKARELQVLHHDIAGVVLACHAHEDVLCKVTIEISLLTEEEKMIACQIAKEARADIVKTSTGFHSDGVTDDDIRLMRSILGEMVGIEASGDIATVAHATAMLEAGATRIGTREGVAIAREFLGLS